MEGNEEAKTVMMVMVMVMVTMMVMVMVEIEPHQRAPQQNSPDESDDNEATTIERFLTRNKKQKIFYCICILLKTENLWNILGNCLMAKVEVEESFS